MASRRHRLPDCSVPLHLITASGSWAHLDSLWLTFLPGMINFLRGIPSGGIACLNYKRRMVPRPRGMQWKVSSPDVVT